MNKENILFLLNNLKFLGFGEEKSLSEQLWEGISRQSKEFQLHVESFYDDDYKMDISLYFKNGENTDRYYFNKYHAVLMKADAPERDRMQTFYIRKGIGITMKEAYNMLQGRAVNRNMISFEGERFNAWMQLNFAEMTPSHNYRMKLFRPEYGYDLEVVLKSYPIRELQMEESKANLLKALRRGNLQPVHFLKVKKEEKMYIEANPQFKTINIYSSTSNALQKLYKKQDSIFKTGVQEIPEGLEDPQVDEWEEENSVSVEESEGETEQVTVGNPAPPKKGKN